MHKYKTGDKFKIIRKDMECGGNLNVFDYIGIVLPEDEGLQSIYNQHVWGALAFKPDGTPIDPNDSRLVGVGVYYQHEIEPYTGEVQTNKVGLHRKYFVEKADGSPTDPNAEYFVLRLDKDEHAINAIEAYAKSIRGENPVLAVELLARVEQYWNKVNAEAQDD